MDNRIHKEVKSFSMDTKKLDAFLLAVERGSLTAAAEEMGYTQSGLTNMMNALETELGLKLLTRSKSGVGLTEQGQGLLPFMHALQQDSHRLSREAERLRRRGADTLRLGAYSSVARQWLPAMLAEFRADCPDTDVSIYVGGLPDLYEKLRDDSLDCAILSYSEARSQGMSWVPLRDDPLVAVLPEEPAPSVEAFPVSGFAGQEFLMPSAGFEEDIAPVFGKGPEHIVSRILNTNLDDAAIVSMVEHRLGVSILSELVMRDMPYAVRALPLDPPAFRHLGVAMASQRSEERGIQRLVRCARQTIAHMYRGDSPGVREVKNSP